MQIYPPLSRRRALALELKALADTEYAERLEALNPVVATRVLHSLATDISKARIDFTQHTETYYFQEEDPDLSLSHQLSYALMLRDAAAASASPDLRAAAALLDRALNNWRPSSRKTSWLPTVIVIRSSRRTPRITGAPHAIDQAAGPSAPVAIFPAALPFSSMKMV